MTTDTPVALTRCRIRGNRFSTRTTAISLVCTVVVSGVLALAACSRDDLGDLTVPQGNDPATYWALTLNHHAINLALTPGSDTVHLHVTPRAFSGAALANAPGTPIYTSSDATALTVTSDGLVTARAVSDQSSIVVRMTVGDVTHYDTAFVRVIPTAPASPLQTFSIQPAPNDSTLWSVTSETKVITPKIRTTTGDSIPNLLVAMSSSDPGVFRYDGALGGFFAGIRGSAIVTASTYAFGVSASDTVTYTITYPLLFSVDIGQLRTAANPIPVVYFMRDTVVLQAGATVFWSNRQLGATKSVGIVFDDSVALGGNIAPIPPLTPFGGFMMFPRPGKYIYHDTDGQATGLIDVRSNRP